jgi:hypothetical protein
MEQMMSIKYAVRVPYHGEAEFSSLRLAKEAATRWLTTEPHVIIARVDRRIVSLRSVADLAKADQLLDA